MRLSTLRVLALAVATVALPTLAHAAPVAAPAAAPADDFKPYIGAVTGDDVYVRSGPTEGFYATSKLNKGDRVTVVGLRGLDQDYLKVVPPEGSFCYVAKAYVELAPGGQSGKVTRSDLIVRAGSTLNNKMNTMLMKLDQGDSVQLVGTQDDGKYFKIAPPAGAYLFVKKTLVAPVPDAGPVSVSLAAQAKEHEPISSDPPAPSVATATPKTAPVAPPVQPPAVAPVAEQPTKLTPPPAEPPIAPPPPAVVTTVTPSPAAPSTQPTAGTDNAALASAGLAAPATTQPTVVAKVTPPATTRPALTSRQLFDRAEVEFAKLGNGTPADHQLLAGLKWRYKTLSTDAKLPAEQRQIAGLRQGQLADRIAARDQMDEANKAVTLANEKQKALAAEHDELVNRQKEQQVVGYAAVGTLRISSLQQTGTTLYRLTDPNTGRTLIYLRSNDPKYSGLVNQFIGVNGPITQDANLSLRYVSPIDAEPVDQGKVTAGGVTAAVMPPSLLPKSTASVGGN